MAKHVIIGAAPTGCMLALKLARAGHEVTIYEAGDKLFSRIEDCTGRIHQGHEVRHRNPVEGESLKVAEQEFIEAIESIRTGAFHDVTFPQSTTYLADETCPLGTAKEVVVEERFISPDQLRQLFASEFARLGVAVNFGVTAQKNERDQLILVEKSTGTEIRDWMHQDGKLSLCIGASASSLLPIAATQMPRTKRAAIIKRKRQPAGPSICINSIKGGASVSADIADQAQTYITEEKSHKILPSGMLTKQVARMLTDDAKQRHLQDPHSTISVASLRIAQRAQAEIEKAGGQADLDQIEEAKLVQLAVAVQRNSPLNTTQTGLVETLEVKLPGQVSKAVVGASRKITTSVQAANAMINEHKYNELLKTAQAATASQSRDLKRKDRKAEISDTSTKRVKPLQPCTPTRSPSPVTPERMRGNMPTLLLGGIDPSVRARRSPNNLGLGMRPVTATPSPTPMIIQ